MTGHERSPSRRRRRRPPRTPSRESGLVARRAPGRRSARSPAGAGRGDRARVLSSGSLQFRTDRGGGRGGRRRDPDRHARRDRRLLPGSRPPRAGREADRGRPRPRRGPCPARAPGRPGDRKSTRLNSSHEWISYAVFCLKKKKKTYITTPMKKKKKKQKKKKHKNI